MTTKNIAFLDRNSLPQRIEIPPPLQPHNWTNYTETSLHEIKERCSQTDVIVTNKVPITRELLSACPRVAHIAVSATGYNIVDLDACREFGVSVSNIPSYAATTVSEHVITSALTLRRKLLRYRQQVIDNAWQASPTFCLFDQPISDLTGATLGIIGLGEIGRATARLGAALGLDVIYYSRSEHKFGSAQAVSLNNLLQTSDIISVHCSLTTETENLISMTEIAQMKTSAILINTARGGIVNEADVVDAIKSERIGGIAFDVLVSEPPETQTPMLTIADRDNVIITPHIAWASEQAMHGLADILSANINAFLAGSPQNIVS